MAKSADGRISWAMALMLLALAGPACAGDWAGWRGPEQTGVSREKNLPETWSPDGENLLWTNKIGGMSSPVVMKGKIYTLTRVGEDEAPSTLIPGPRTQESLVCVDLATGKTLWEHRENITQTEVPFHRLGWSNVVADPQSGNVYALFVHCLAVCVDGQTGKLIWKRQMTEEFGLVSTFGGRTSSPAIDEDQLFIAGVAFGWGDQARGQHRVFALDKNTGELNWTTNTGGTPVDVPMGTPVVAVIGGQRLVIIGAGDGGVHAFQARSGRKVWSVPISKRGINSTVLVDGTRVYVCHSEENLQAATLGAVVCLEVADHKPRELWRVDGLEAGFASPTIVGGRLYVADNKCSVFALDAMTGKQYWRRNTGTIGKASLVWGDGKLYVPEANGRFTILKPGETKADVLGRTEIPEKLGREFAIFGSVAIADGKVIVQAANAMYCIGSKDHKTESEPIPAGAKEEPAAADAKVAVIQVRPADALLHPGEKKEFSAWGFDEAGRNLGRLKGVTWSVDGVMIPPPPSAPAGTAPTKAGSLAGSVDDRGTFTAAGGAMQAGSVAAKVGEVSGISRVRVMPPLPWKIDFEDAAVGRPPLTWIGAGGKFAVREVDGNKVLVKLTDFDLYARARTNLGDVAMSNYTIQADLKAGFKMSGEQRQVPDAGIINSRYVLVLLGNHQRAQIHVWSPTLPYSLNRTIDFAWEPGAWYTLKLRVEPSGGKSLVKGKVWKTGEAEPSAWTLELEDPMPNTEGNPGLYGNSLVAPFPSEVHYDNVILTSNK